MPLRQPPRRAADGKEHREHLDREADGGVDDAGVEVDVGIETVLDEIVVRQGHPLQLQRDVEQRAATGDRQHVIRDLLDDLRPRVVILVNAMAEPHQAQFAAADPLHVLGDPADRSDFLEHPQHLLIRAAVQRAVERGGGSRGG